MKTLLHSLPWILAFVVLAVVGFVGVSDGLSAARANSCVERFADRVKAGVAAVEDERYQDGIEMLAPVVEAHPACTTDEYGTVAYWLGRAYGATDRVKRQLDLWKQSLQAVQAQDRPVDLRLADAYVHRVYQERDGRYYDSATDAYLRLLAEAPVVGERRGADRLRQHVRLTGAVLPPDLASDIGWRRAARTDPPVDLVATAGQRMARWWRTQDPLPATRLNERMDEHLERVAHVRQEFEKDGQLDDRALVYVRLGPPSRETKIRFNSIRFNESVLGLNSRFSSSDFRQGEFWVYEQIDRSTQYLFVEVKRDVFEIGNAVSMLPTELQRGFSSTSRGQEEAAAFIRAMEEAYSQLAIYHDRYHSRYQRLSSYSLDLDQGQTGSVARRNRALVAEARKTMLEIREADNFHNRQRAEDTPQVYSEADPPTASIPIVVRSTRFLQPRGSTRVETFWSAPYAGLQTEDGNGRYEIMSVLVQRNAEGARLNTKRARHTVTIEPGKEGAFLRPQILNVLVDEDSQTQINMQWDQYRANPSTPNTAPGTPVGRAVYRSGLVDALDASPSALLMSDLRPMVTPTQSPDPADAIPYPFSQIAPGAPLALYFEVYHLTFGGDDRTRYGVEYEVYRRNDRGGFVELFRGDEETVTTTRATYEGNRRKAEEYILLDLDEWSGDGVLRITVRVTDEVSGQTTERSIQFDAIG